MSKTFHDNDFDDELDTDEYGVIVNPGKFEGEPSWVKQLWDRALSGFSDETVHDGSMAIDAFKLDAGLAALTGLDASPDHYICLWSDDNGSVNHMLMTQDQLFACEGMPVEDEGFHEYMENDNTIDLGGESGY